MTKRISAALIALLAGAAPTFAATAPTPPVPLATATTPGIVPSLGGAGGVPVLDSNGLFTLSQVPPVSATSGVAAPVPVNVMAPFTTGLYALYSCLPLLNSYTGTLCTVRRETDGGTLAITSSPGSYNSAAILAWAAGSDVYISAVNDQSGGGHNLSIATAQQPRLALGGAYPTMEFDGQSAYINANTALGGWLQGASGASVVALRKNDTTNATQTSHPIIFASSGTSAASARLSMGLDTTIGASVVQGRKLDADALNRSGGFVADAAWDAEIGRWDYTNALVYHSTTVAAETRTFQTAGSVSNTASLSVAIGNSNGGAIYFQGKIAALALYTVALTDAQTIAVTQALNGLVPAVAAPPFTLDWLGGGQTGTYTLAPGLTNYTVDTPDGTTPAYSDLASMRYHHHTKVALLGTRLFVAYSAAPSSEEQGGQFVEINSATAPWTTPYGPQVAVPPQSLPLQLTGLGDNVGTRVAYPRTFVTVAGNLYLVSAVDQVNTTGSAQSYQQGVALIAVQCNADGTLGTPFLVGPMPYTVLSGVTAYSYNNALSPQIYAAAANFGTWGGSAPGQPASLWFGAISQNGNYFNEPTTVALNTAGTSLLRLFRKNTGAFQSWLYTAKSTDGGRTFSPITRNNVPSAVSETTGLALADGRIVVVGNPINLSGSAFRDPLYVAAFGATTGQLCGVPYAVRQGLSNTPTYANGQTGGAAYPGITSDGTNLYISYSITKQAVGMTTVPLASLASCN